MFEENDVKLIGNLLDVKFKEVEKMLHNSDEMLTDKVEKMLHNSEEMLIDEIGRTHKIMLQHSTELKSEVKGLKQDSAVGKSNNDTMAMLLKRIEILEERIAALEQKIA